MSTVFLDKHTKNYLKRLEIQNSIQDWVFTTVYRLQKSAWIKACYNNLDEVKQAAAGKLDNLHRRLHKPTITLFNSKTHFILEETKVTFFFKIRENSKQLLDAYWT